MSNLSAKCTQHYKDVQASRSCPNDCIDGILIYIDGHGFNQQAPCLLHWKKELLINIEDL